MKLLASASTADGIISIMREYWHSEVTIAQASLYHWDIVKSNGDRMEGYHVVHDGNRWRFEEE
jgi:hypothetical protein